MGNLHKSKAEIDNLWHNEEQTTSEEGKHSQVKLQRMRFSYFISDLMQNSRQSNLSHITLLVRIQCCEFSESPQNLTGSNKESFFFPDNQTLHLLSSNNYHLCQLISRLSLNLKFILPEQHLCPKSVIPLWCSSETSSLKNSIHILKLASIWVRGHCN